MTVEVDGATLRRALRGLGWEGIAVYFARKVRGGVEIGCRRGVAVWKCPRRRRSKAIKVTKVIKGAKVIKVSKTGSGAR